MVYSGITPMRNAFGSKCRKRIDIVAGRVSGNKVSPEMLMECSDLLSNSSFVLGPSYWQSPGAQSHDANATYSFFTASPILFRPNLW